MTHRREKSVSAEWTAEIAAYIADLQAQIRDLMEDRTRMREANIRTLKHEAETPMRGHDADGACCRRARLGETP